MIGDISTYHEHKYTLHNQSISLTSLNTGTHPSLLPCSICLKLQSKFWPKRIGDHLKWWPKYVFKAINKHIKFPSRIWHLQQVYTRISTVSHRAKISTVSQRPRYKNVALRLIQLWRRLLVCILYCIR